MTSGGDEHAVPASITDSGKPERFVLSARQWSLLEPCLRPPLRDLHNLAAMLRSRTALPIMPLSIQDETGNFDCGVAILNEGLRRDIAAAKTMAGSAFALRHEGHIAGYYRLRPSSFVRAEDGAAIAIQFLPRLAVNRRDQSAGMGRALLADAIRRTASAGDGTRALYVHALSEPVMYFYRRFGFRPAPPPVDPLGLFLPVEDIVQAAEI